jgi:hypothetical protein
MEPALPTPASPHAIAEIHAAAAAYGSATAATNSSDSSCRPHGHLRRLHRRLRSLLPLATAAVITATLAAPITIVTLNT